MGDWLNIGEVGELIPPQLAQNAADLAEIQGRYDTIRLDALAGPQETMHAAGFTNRGSLAYAMKERGFPQPVKTLRGIRLWDLDAVNQWRRDIED